MKSAIIIIIVAMCCITLLGALCCYRNRQDAQNINDPWISHDSHKSAEKDGGTLTQHMNRLNFLHLSYIIAYFDFVCNIKILNRYIFT